VKLAALVLDGLDSDLVSTGDGETAGPQNAVTMKSA
jgi:hypothetical protein